MRIRESAYMALLCLFFSVYNSSAQSDANEVHKGWISSKDNWDIQYLSQPKLQLQGLQVNNKAIFSSLTQCEIYDLRSGDWQTHQFSVPRRGISMVTSGQIAFFAGGARGPKYSPQFLSTVDIYSSANESWNQANLSQAREIGASGAYGNVVVFAGGTAKNGFSNRADIFSTLHRKRSQHNLAEARSKIATGAAGNKIVFAGGISGSVKLPSASNAVDIYEVHSGTWSSYRLSEKRYDITAASVGNEIILAGGLTVTKDGIKASSTIEIYDALQNTWSKATLSEAKHGMSVAVAGNKVYFAGGLLDNNVISDRLEVYDLETASWTVTRLSARRTGMAIAVTPSRVIFAGGFIHNLQTTTDRIEILDTETDTWSIEHLSQPRANVLAAAGCGKVIFAGGTDQTGKVATATTDIWKIAPLFDNAFYTSSPLHTAPVVKQRMHDWVYTDPKNQGFIVADLWKYETQTVRISILNAHRQTVLTKSVVPLGDTKEPINVSALQEGRYWVVIESDGRKPLLIRLNIGHTGFEQDGDQKILAMSGDKATHHLTSQY